MKDILLILLAIMIGKVTVWYLVKDKEPTNMEVLMIICAIMAIK
jgi:hypothetical protein